MNYLSFERFTSKFTMGDGCWNWSAAVCKDGYGKIKIEGKDLRAHRVSYEEFVGPILPEFVIDHLCRNPKCVRPSHLESVSVRENTIRGMGPTAKAAAKTHCHKGHPFEGSNLYIRPKNAGRSCRTCHSIQGRLAYIKKKALR